MDIDLKFKKYDKKRTLEGQLSDLMTDLKSVGIKIIENSKLHNGYGEGVCLVLTQLLDKYLINQNFIFKKPKFVDNKNDEIQTDFEEVLLEESNDKTQNNFRYNSSKNRLVSGGKGKRYSSGMSTTTQGKI